MRLDRVQGWTEKAAKAAQMSADGLAIIGLVLLLVQGFAITADALSRWLLRAPIHGLEDLNGLLIAVTLTCFMPLLMARRGNITIRLLGQSLSPTFALWLDAFGQIMLTGFVFVVTWHYGLYALDLGVQYSPIVEIPRQPSAFMATGLLGITLIVQIISCLASIGQAIHPEKAQP
ncbi:MULTISPECIES: TRAP transporter small permease subunit [unclassified Iodidimonas]|jgi:TRAP-type C4-dicarboxylate transport system permease small subunit|uniref:TRAP transporter small permease subunit n=1 Tax=unclassified Iodidimonas TaxID=2626145 RepID=UPI002482AB1B|nr:MULTISPECIES: TRAP transporter small permease subunit [unclassified Iodidimonas]